MNKDNFIEYCRSQEGKKDIVDLYEGIKADYFEENDLKFEELILKLIYTLELSEEEPSKIYNGNLNQDYVPQSVASSGKTDFELDLGDEKLAVEVSLRPRIGYIEHFEHLEGKDYGVFIFLDSKSIPPEVWETFYSNFDRYSNTFVPLSFDILRALLNAEKPKKSFSEVVDKVKNEYQENNNWRDFREETMKIYKIYKNMIEESNHG